MTNDWIEFKENSYELKRKLPRVLLTELKLFRLNRKALELIGNPKAVCLFYDAGRNRIGIRADENGSNHSLPIRMRDRGGQTGTVHAAMFCNRFGIRPEVTIEFDSVRVDADGTLILELGTAKTVPPRMRMRKV